MFTHLFWRSAVERAVKTFAQTLAALFGASGIGLFEAPWSAALSAAGMAAVLSVLTSMSSEPVGDRDTPSLVSTAPHAQPPVEQQPSVLA